MIQAIEDSNSQDNYRVSSHLKKLRDAKKAILEGLPEDESKFSIFRPLL